MMKKLGHGYVLIFILYSITYNNDVSNLRFWGTAFLQYETKATAHRTYLETIQNPVLTPSAWQPRFLLKNSACALIIMWVSGPKMHDTLFRLVVLALLDILCRRLVGKARCFLFVARKTRNGRRAAQLSIPSPLRAGPFAAYWQHVMGPGSKGVLAPAAWEHSGPAIACKKC